VVPPRYGLALRDFLVEPIKLGQHNHALQRVHPSPYADPGMHITLALPMHPNFPARLGDAIVAGEDRPTIPVTAQRLARKKTGTANRT
jgi:hypothetical protein